MDRLKSIGTDIRDGWQGLDKKKKNRLVILVVLATLIIGGLAYFTQRTNYTVLFSNLDEAEAGSIVEDLETQGLDYELSDGGTTILIDEAELDEYRINLATNGLMPNTSTGFELFDESGMMTTDDDRAIMYQRAVQSELENAIRSLDQVNEAQVILNLPEESIFQNPEYQRQSSASIRINTSGTLTNQSIQGIASLVSGSVPNLPVQNVNIVDSQGTLLSGFLQDGGEGSIDMSSNNQAIRRAFEEDMEQRIAHLLGGNTRVSVYAEMNFEAVEGERHTYENPMDDEINEILDGEVEQERRGLLRSETVSGSGTGNYGSLIAIENIPETDDEDAEDGENTSIDTTRNYELNEESERYVRAPGIVEGLTATVLVDSEELEILGLSNEEGQIEGMVARAIGLAQVDINGEDINPADYIDVHITDLSSGGAEDTPVGGGDFMEELVGSLIGLWPYLVGSLVLIIIVILILRTVRKREGTDELEEFPDTLPRGMEPAVEPVELEPFVPQVDAVEERRKAKKEHENKVMDEKEEKVKNTAKENPELAAELMKIWMTDNKNN